MATAKNTSNITPGGLRCEYSVNPLGVDALRPRLSWVLESPKRAQKQTAYQILVASSLKRLEADEGDIWDTGRVISDRSIQVAYAGPPLLSRKRYYWKVRVWDKEGSVSAFSEPAFWEMGLLEERDWKAQWIGVPPVYTGPDNGTRPALSFGSR